MTTPRTREALRQLVEKWRQRSAEYVALADANTKPELLTFCATRTGTFAECADELEIIISGLQEGPVHHHE